ncbi:hypothetical protein Mapa_001227 [Marchantia paleacea]|nr:hypothetical protein Mapa_001227 [Marchantia paleacea]
MSCNGCRVLRKGCSESCILRPCLQWIDTPDSQGHATVFVAKFFGRSGLMGFISAVPPSQRPNVFQSLLYEACGRTVNPVFGAVGLLWAGKWDVCQAAVETVLKGGSLRPPSPTAMEVNNAMSNAGIRNIPFPGVKPSQNLSCPSDTAGLSASGEKSECFSKVREDMMEGFYNARCGTNASHQTNLMSEVESSPASEIKKGADVGVPSVQQFGIDQCPDEGTTKFTPVRLEFPSVRGVHMPMSKRCDSEKREHEERTDGPLVLVPLARRVCSRNKVPDLRLPCSFATDAPVGRVENDEREKLELDLTLSSVSAAKEEPKGWTSGFVPLGEHKIRLASKSGIACKGMKRVSSPNSSESVNSEGSVTSLDSTCDLSLSRASTGFWKAHKCGPGPVSSSHSRKALTLFHT